MSEVMINYRGSAIATMDASGTKTLQTEGKLCDDDIEVVYSRPSGGGGLTHLSGDITPVSNTQYLSVTGMSGTPKFIKYVIDNMDSTESGGGKDGVLKMMRGLYTLGASIAQITNNGGTGYGNAYYSPVETWESITPTVYADETQPGTAGQIIATTTGFCARSYNSSYSFKAGYTYNWEAWF